MDINIQVQTIKRCQSLNQIYPKTFYIYVPTGQSLVEQIPKVSREENRQSASACLTPACLATKSKSGAKWQEVLFCKVQCLALEMKAGCFPDKPKVTGCLSTRRVLQEVLRSPNNQKRKRTHR